MFGFLFPKEEADVDFDYMYKKYKNSVYMMIDKVYTDPAEADDALQEIFSKYYLSMHKVKGEYESRRWLMRIAYNTLINIGLKKETYQRHIELVDDIDDVVAMNLSKDPIDEVLKAELAEKIQVVLESMKVPMREVVEMKYYMGFTVEEIALVQNVATSTVYYRLAQAEQILYNYLNNYVFENEKGKGGTMYAKVWW